MPHSVFLRHICDCHLSIIKDNLLIYLATSLWRRCCSRASQTTCWIQTE